MRNGEDRRKKTLCVPQLGKLASDKGGGINSSAPYCRCKKFMIIPYSKRKCGVNFAQVLQRQRIERRFFQRACKVFQRIVFSNSSEGNGKKIDTCPLHKIENQNSYHRPREENITCTENNMGGGYSQQNNHPPCVLGLSLVKEKMAKFLCRGTRERKRSDRNYSKCFLVFPLEPLIS